MQTPNTIQRKIIQKPLAWHIYVWANVCLFAFVYIFMRTHTHGSPHCAYNLAQVPWPVRLLEKGWPKTKEKKYNAASCCRLLVAQSGEEEKFSKIPICIHSTQWKPTADVVVLRSYEAIWLSIWGSHMWKPFLFSFRLLRRLLRLCSLYGWWYFMLFASDLF